MKRLFLLCSLVCFALQSFSQVRIEKRRYQRGWYISLTDHKKKTHNVKNGSASSFEKKETTAEPPIEATATADTAIVPAETTIFPATASAVTAQKKSSASFFAPPKIKLPPSLPAKKKIVRRSFTLPHPAKHSRSLTGDNDMWGLLGQALLWLLIGIVVCALLFAIIDAVLVAAYGEAAAGAIELAACAAIMVVYYLVKGSIWLVQKIAEHHKDKVNREKYAQ